MKIKYDLQVFHNIVLFKVLEMDEKYRSTNDSRLLFTSSNGMEIRSYWSPQMDENYIYVLGKDNENDTIIEMYTTKNNQEAQEYADKVRFALEEWNNNEEEWNNNEEIMEIEFKLGTFENNKYMLQIEECCNTFNVIKIINKRWYIIKDYYTSDYENEGIPLDKTIIMFNHDCELLNIPFRLRGED